MGGGDGGETPWADVKPKGQPLGTFLFSFDVIFQRGISDGGSA